MNSPRIILFFIIIISISSCTEIKSPEIKENIESEPGNNYISINDVTSENIENTLNLAGNWLLNSQNEDGSMKYKYLPDEDRYPKQNNMIRQFMATLALAELYENTQDNRYKEAYERNLHFNIFHYYYEEEEFGYIFYNDNAKLGSAAIALMSVLPSEKPIYNEKKIMLKNFIIFLHNESGRFRTFYIPPEADRNHNFYPGEAMLALMMAYEKEKEPDILDTVDKSFQYYSGYFRKASNPAFVPWQTMAIYRLYQAQKKTEYADFIFEMNDWLIQIQETSCANPNYLGRFYDPSHKEYGPPHSSSTAVYVEGLTYAYSLAKELDDTDKMIAYRNSILLGVRSLLQLQYTEYNKGNVSEENRIKVHGGIRKTVDNPELRIDNTQHTVMALLRVMEIFNEKDIRDFKENYPYCQIS